VLTYFEVLDSLVSAAKADGKSLIEVSAIEDAMVRDQHRMFHDAEFSDGCPICDRERVTEG